jgi:protein involved in polysaccharide export with SLBB domain
MSFRRSSTIGSRPARLARSLAGLGLLVLAFAGCAGTKPPVGRQALVAFTAEQRQALASADAAPYRLQRGDVLKLDFFYHEELDQDRIIILPDGALNLVGVDRIAAAGLTISELDSMLTEKYRQDYLNPDLSIVVQEIAGRQVYVLGVVERPGLHDVPRGGIDLVSAVTVAGGFTDDAKKSATVLVRVTPEGYMCQEIDLDSFHRAGARDLALLQLQPYDVIYVPRSRIGDFAYFASTVLSGILDMTNVALNVRLIGNPNYLRRN